MKTWKKLLIGAFATTTILGGVAAVAIAKDGHGWRQGQGGPRMMIDRMFTEMDRGAKGSVTLDDVNAFITARFTEADTDKNGYISEAEVKAAAVKKQAEMGGKMFDRMAGADGKIELKGRMGDRLKDADTNKDGVVDKAEFDAFGAKRMGERGGRGIGGMYDLLAEGDKGIAKARIDEIAKRRFARADVDKNGMVTKDEFLAAAPGHGGPDGKGGPGGWHKRHGGGEGGPRFGMGEEGGPMGTHRMGNQPPVTPGATQL